MTGDARPTPDAPDDDPWLWLEDIEGARAVAWVAAQNQATLARFGGPVFEADRDALAAIFDRPDNIPFVRRRGGLLYNVWRDAEHPRGLWRRTTLDRFRQPAPEWEILLDLDALAAADGEDWIWAGAAVLPGAHDRAMLSLSRGGGDAAVLREFDLERRALVPGGFELPEAKGGADWIDRDTLLVSSAFGGATRSGYARTVRLWTRGSPPREAPILFEVPEASMAASGSVDREVPGRLFFVEQTGFYDAITWFGDAAGPALRLDVPTDSWSLWHGDWLAVRPRTPWAVGGLTHAPGSLLGIGLRDFLGGSRQFETLYAPGERQALQDAFWAGGRLVAHSLDALRPVTEVFTPSPQGWRRERLDGLPRLGVVSVWRLDAEEAGSTGDLLVAAQDPLTPPSLLLTRPGLAAPELLKRQPPAFDAAGLVVSRHEAVSEDGTRIPYTQSGPPGETGDAPLHLTGYGGFEVSELPVYRSSIGKLWLERGGTSVVATLRGGGEFGPAWHDAGRRERKTLSHADFAAVAADLVRRGVTRPSRIAAEGGSNGGLLIGNMLTRYPERFGALLCTIPLLDMRRYTKLLAGPSWIEEYGDPDRAEDWAFLRAISAYHQAVPGRPYPPILLATTRRDDRVHPGHARKMAAKLQALGYQAFFYEPAAGGHGHGKDNRERAAFTALGYAFLRRAIGQGLRDWA